MLSWVEHDQTFIALGIEVSHQAYTFLLFAFCCVVGVLLLFLLLRMLFIIYLIMHKVYYMVCASAWAIIQMVKRVDYLPLQTNTPHNEVVRSFNCRYCG